jgi:L-fuconate dehydratase
VLAAQQRALPLIGQDVDILVGDLGATYRGLTSDSQLRWLGPAKGVEHLAMAAVMNAVWDLAARKAGKPLWRLLAEMEPTRAARIAELEGTGYPCYTTSAGWLGYSDKKLRRLCQEAVDSGYRHIKLKVGSNLDDDIRRRRIAREVIGDDANLMIDANQVWDVPEAIEWVTALAEFKPLWIEEPTSPDDVLGHAAVRRAVAPIGVATGEHGMNRVLFKQMFQAEAIDFCPHAGGVGLCELVQHRSVFDYVAVSGSLDGRVTEYVDHLHEHFTDPCIVENGAYRLPALPGYSAQMHADSVARFAFPDGGYWLSTGSGRASAEVVESAAV